MGTMEMNMATMALPNFSIVILVQLSTTCKGLQE